MKLLLSAVALTVIGLGALLGARAFASTMCGSYWQPYSPDTFGGSCSSGTAYTTITKTGHWRIFYLDGHEVNDVIVTDTGECKSMSGAGTICWPQFDTPYWESNTNIAVWNQKTKSSS